MPHTCHAYGCDVEVPPKMLMCLKHWRMVPRRLQALVWTHYRPGQEEDKQPSHDYILVQRAAVSAVFVAEGRTSRHFVPTVGSKEYMLGPACLARREKP